MTEVTAERFTGTMPVQERLRIDPTRLSEYLADYMPGLQTIDSVRQFKGGQSNPTYLLDTNLGRFVCRRKPPGKLLPKAHAIEREYRVMTALGKTDVPVPETVCLCEDPSVIGTPFFVMAYLEGRIFWSPHLPGEPPDSRAAIYDAMNQTLAALHRVDPASVGLDDYGRPGNYVARQTAVWTRQYRASETEVIPEMDALIDWLPAHIPDDHAVSVVHGDFRLDNVVFHPTEPRVLGILDWELSTLGHPLVDFAYHCMAYRLPPNLMNGLAGTDLKRASIPSEEAFVAAYCERTGRNSIPNMEYYLAFNMFRLAAIAQGIRGRMRDGTATSKHAAKLAALTLPMAEQAWQLAQKIG